MYQKNEFLALIRSHINKYGYHVTTVTSTTDPKYSYTIGLSDLFDFELIFAGGIIYLKNELSLIIDTVVEQLKKGNSTTDLKVQVDSLGTFSLADVDASWAKLMMLGVFDFYKVDEIKAFQIIPDASHFTLDIPDMTKAWNASSEPVWQWLNSEWDYLVPKGSIVITNTNALLGQAVTEVARWEDNEWDMFAGAGPDVEKKDMRVVSLGTMLGIDKTLLPAINLAIGAGLWRGSDDSDWNIWE